MKGIPGCFRFSGTSCSSWMPAVLLKDAPGPQAGTARRHLLLSAFQQTFSASIFPIITFMAPPIGCSHQSPPVAGSESLQHIPHGLESEMTQRVEKGFNEKLEQTAVIRADSEKCHLHTTSPFYPPLYSFLQPCFRKFCTVPYPLSNIPIPHLPSASPLLSVANSRVVLSKALPAGCLCPINW